MRGGGHAHFPAHGADLGDELDDPTNLRLSLGIGGESGLRPWPQRENLRARRTFFALDRPKLLGQERHEGVQQREDLIENIGDRCLRLRPRRTALACLQHGLGEFEMPVAEDVPDEAVGGVGGVVES